ncbi:MAG TPA: hypothetical protein VIV11_27900 [Kofleriaceae bacterium]
MRALLVIALAGCGRVGFDVGGDAGADAFTGGVFCGDLACAVNAGESCTTCADCATLADICGNGACSSPEVGSCYADCGPIPWPWQSEATTLVSAVNIARVNGATCPGGGGVQMAPALTYDAALEPTAREWAWETAHLGWVISDGCNGRTATDRVTDAGASSGWKVYGATSPMMALSFLLADMASCNAIMNATNTMAGAAGAHDVMDAYAIFLR